MEKYIHSNIGFYAYEQVHILFKKAVTFLPG